MTNSSKQTNDVVYTIKVIRFDALATGNDEAQAIEVETVGRMSGTNVALEYASMWSRHDTVAAVWVEPQTLLN